MNEAVYDLNVGDSFKKLPEVYQIEICSACDLQCPMCLRTTHLGRQPGLLDIKLLELMHKRGDFSGTTYTELQMAGEPTLHPKLWEIINFLKYDVRVLVGMSTHGLSIKKKKSIVMCLGLLDAVTISVDSLDPETYHKMRYPAHVEDLIENLRVFFGYIATRDSFNKPLPLIELQLVKTSLAEKSGDVETLVKFLKEQRWDKYAVVRTIYDCFTGMQDRELVQITPTKKRELCLNPFSSLSVTSNGDVVSCCFIFSPNKSEINYYGNLYEQSLEEIWNSDKLQKMREIQLDYVTGKTDTMPDQCGKCTAVSPCTIHTQIVSRLVRTRGI